jgi:hypothetical protein
MVRLASVTVLLVLMWTTVNVQSAGPPVQEALGPRLNGQA